VLVAKTTTAPGSTFDDDFEKLKEEILAEFKEWVRREIRLAAIGVTEDERAEVNP
jgi:hypothetical protein